MQRSRRRALADTAVPPRAVDREAFLRQGTVFGPSQSRFLSHWIGGTVTVAAIVAGISLAFPPAEDANVSLSVALSCVALATGLALLAGALERAPAWTFQIVLGTATALACFGVYAAGSPTSGAQMFFLWASPLAFAFFSRRAAIGQVAWIATGYAVVLAVQHAEHPEMGSAGLLTGMWILVVATVFVVGLLVERLSGSLRDVDQRFALSFSDSPIGAAFMTSDLVWLEVNDALCEMIGWREDVLVGSAAAAVLHPDDAEAARAVCRDLEHATVRFDLRFTTPDASVISVAVSAATIRPRRGVPYVFMQFVDVTEHMADRAALAHRAIHDPLTGLFNRTLLLDRLTRALDHGTPATAIVMLDLDQFKVVNDSLGHQIGDELLGMLAPRLAAATRHGDTLARFGGDEFVVLCERVRDPLDALDRAGRLADALRAPVTLETGDYVISGSFGVAIASASTEDAATLLRDADAAMYRAKAAGRNRIEMFDNSMRLEAVARLELENDLRRAVERGELELEYQPVIDLTTGRPVTLEALVRWNHPGRGRLEPAEFIALAEETGLITMVGDWVLETALGQLARWQDEFPGSPPLGVTVNVSGRQLGEPELARKIAELLRRSGVAPGSLGIEITESVLLSRDLPLDTVNELKALGVVVMLDDFGTGYSSLAYLEQFPIDIIKVDQAFVARIDEGADRTVVLQSILTMARALEIQVIAEGAENEERIRALRALGCNWVQGHAICRPVPVDQVGLFLEERRAILLAHKPGSSF